MAGCNTAENHNIGASDMTTSQSSVSLRLIKASFQRGENVEYSIHNDGTNVWFYGDGCPPPLVDLLIDGMWVALTSRITESVPDPKRLDPGQHIDCRWDMTAWQDLSQSGSARFLNTIELLPVPLGSYRLRMELYHTADAVAEQKPGDLTLTTLLLIE
jgi:hypothetical protein